MKCSLISTLPLLCGALVGLFGCSVDARNFESGPGGAGGSGGEGGGGGAGGSGMSCSAPEDCPAGENETAACIEGQCSVTCNQGLLDCDPDVPGCETSALAKTSCGACGTACATECVPTVDGGEPFCNDPIDISAGYNHTCVIRRDGSLWCWGRNEVGELGILTPGSVPVPLFVPLPGKAKKVAAGGAIYVGMVALAHTCVILEDTTVYCWGSGNYGQLGLGGSVSSFEPAQVTSLVNAVDLSAGGGHTCAVKSDGDLFCWGLDENGQVGDGMAQDATTPKLIMGNAKSVDAGQNHTCAIMQTGSLRCWGKNFDGQLGTGDSTDRLAPAEVGIPLKLNVDEVATGDRHTCARKGNEAYCFGNDYNGACAANKWGPVPDPTLVAVPAVTHIAVGRERSGAVSSAAGLVKMWGVAPLGDGGGGVTGTPVDVSIEGVAKIAGGYQHTCVLKTNGEVWCWGEDNDEQLGNGPGKVTEPTPVPVFWGDP